MRNANPEHEQIFFGVEYHFLADGNSDHGGIVEGYGATFGHPLENGVVVDQGAFKKTIAERIKRQSGSMVPYLDSHEWANAHVLGTVVDASEDARGLHFKAQLSKAPSAQDTIIKMREGHIRVNSIGFSTVREGYVTEQLDGKSIKRRHLQETKLYEISAVPIAMDPQADITKVHGLVPFQDLPLAPRDYKFDPKAARERVIAWAKRGDEIDWAKFRKAFLRFHRDQPEDVDLYQFQIADLVDGELMAVPAALQEAAEAIQVHRGLLEEKPKYCEQIERYFDKMAEEFHDDSIVPP